MVLKRFTQEITYFSKGPKRFSPFMIPKMIGNILSGEVAIRFGLHVLNFGIVTACASATHSMGEALRIIQYGEADAMVVGGAEAPINPLGLGGFCALKALCTDRNDDPTSASRPFDANRSGFVMGEGAGVLVIEEYEHAKARGAKFIANSLVTDALATHITSLRQTLKQNKRLVA